MKQTTCTCNGAQLVKQMIDGKNEDFVNFQFQVNGMAQNKVTDPVGNGGSFTIAAKRGAYEIGREYPFAAPVTTPVPVEPAE